MFKFGFITLCNSCEEGDRSFAFTSFCGGDEDVPSPLDYLEVELSLKKYWHHSTNPIQRITLTRQDKMDLDVYTNIQQLKGTALFSPSPKKKKKTLILHKSDSSHLHPKKNTLFLHKNDNLTKILKENTLHKCLKYDKLPEKRRDKTCAYGGQIEAAGSRQIRED